MIQLLLEEVKMFWETSRKQRPVQKQRIRCYEITGKKKKILLRPTPGRARGDRTGICQAAAKCLLELGKYLRRGCEKTQYASQDSSLGCRTIWKEGKLRMTKGVE